MRFRQASPLLQPHGIAFPLTRSMSLSLKESFEKCGGSNMITHEKPGDVAIRVVAGLLVREGQVLVCQRNAAAAFPLRWEFPGGKVEDGESDADALQRELREELSVEIEESREVFRNLHQYQNGLGVDLRFHHVIAYTGEVRNLIFHEVRWLDAASLPGLDFLDGDLPIVAALTTGRLKL
jgi:8-oxo-dGTP diphosphatase